MRCCPGRRPHNATCIGSGGYRATAVRTTRFAAGLEPVAAAIKGEADAIHAGIGGSVHIARSHYEVRTQLRVVETLRGEARCGEHTRRRCSEAVVLEAVEVQHAADKWRARWRADQV